MVTKERAEEIMQIYVQAWVERDPELIITIFTEDATYGEGLRGTYSGHEGIKKYWQEKVVGNQSEIKFKLKDLNVNENIVTATWEATFFDKETNKYIHLDSAGIMEIEDGKIKKWRETWISKRSDKPFIFEKD